MKFNLLLTIISMIALGSLGGYVTSPAHAEKEAREAEMKVKKEEEKKTFSIRWDGPTKMFCESKVFRVGDQRVCWLMGDSAQGGHKISVK